MTKDKGMILFELLNGMATLMPDQKPNPVIRFANTVPGEVRRYEVTMIVSVELDLDLGDPLLDDESALIEALADNVSSHLQCLSTSEMARYVDSYVLNEIEVSTKNADLCEYGWI